MDVKVQRSRGLEKGEGKAQKRGQKERADEERRGERNGLRLKKRRHVVQPCPLARDAIQNANPINPACNYASN